MLSRWNGWKEPLKNVKFTNLLMKWYIILWRRVGHHGNHHFWYSVNHLKNKNSHWRSNYYTRSLLFSQNSQWWTNALLSNIEGFSIIHWTILVYNVFIGLSINLVRTFFGLCRVVQTLIWESFWCGHHWVYINDQSMMSFCLS